MRPIDADELKNGIKQQFCLACSSVYPNERCGACDAAECLRYIDESLTIEAEPVKHGRWVHGQCGKDRYIKCSVCKAIIVDTIVSLEGDISQDYFFICPYCGARMDGDSE